MSALPAPPRKRKPALLHARNRVLLLGTLLALANTRPAGAEEVRTGAFPALPGGPRAAATAAADVADPVGAEAVSINPAAIARQRHNHFMASYADLYSLGLVHHSEVAITLPAAALGPSGFAARYLDLGGFDPEAEGPGDPDYAELSLSAAQARALGAFAVGIGGRLEMARGSLEENDDVAANGAALDLGLLFRATADLRFGAMLRNALSAALWSGPSGDHRFDRRPIALSLGFAYKDLLPGLRLLAALESGEERSSALGGVARRYACAAEWHGFNNDLQLRLGSAARANGDELRWLYAGGFQLQVDALELQYAVTFDADALGTTHRFGLGVQWN